MAAKKRAVRSRGGNTGALAVLRRRAEAMMGRLRRAGMQQVRALERQIEKLDTQRQELLSELGASLGGGKGGRRGRPTGSGRGSRSRVDWDQVFAKLPKTSFRASDVRAIVPGVAPGTLSQRLTGWVKEKKLKRTGTRRGTRYVRGA
jgi:hypothetical protein